MQSLKVIAFVCLVGSALGHYVEPRVAQNLPKVNNLMESRIVGGSKAAKGQFPYIVSIQLKDEDDFHFCGGAILSPDWVVATASCFDIFSSYENIIINAGTNKVRGNEDTEQKVGVEKVMRHEKYRQWVVAYDIALIKLNKPLSLSKYVAAINLPAAGAEPSGMAVLSGWGSISSTNERIMPNDLHMVIVPILEFRTCKEALDKSVGSEDLNERMVCTGPLTKRVSACLGDHGGPLVGLNSQNGIELIGLVAFTIGNPCGSQPVPTMYTKVSFYVDWIRERTEPN
ncbi:trypsin-3-like isoform X2 [Prorops nasuta]|uniref:trypsin-3-like isoform X2 n=1 Tax=Prorops nasuta TaxID=863751 RepID=UPI0034CE6C9A